MLEMFEKLINEHGSSAILRERLELFSDKYSMLEDKLKSAQEKNAALEAENRRLAEQIERFEKEAVRLQAQLESDAQRKSKHHLKSEQENLLKVLFTANRAETAARIGGAIGVNESVAQYHIDALKEKGLLQIGPLYINQPITYEISKEGRKYVVEEIGV